ncbi:MAG: hypothetical protein U0998_10720 [Moraxellaceae bacterium]|nr:hypothetical protein [Moraxellaceae bacterium]MDZ4297421.1 hypothetical protein [Moraxellaceae bacterium]MDZ4387644.1 hypothetical protein [Moraxellaceae bacterium]
MKAKFLLAVVIFVNCLSFGPAFAAESSLGPCMVDSMTGKERKEMARWMFFAIAAHPEIKEYSKVSEIVKNKSDEHLANLVMRLLTEDCLSQAKTAFKEEGQVAVAGAFELVGKVAMQELMMNKDVEHAIAAHVKYLDQDKFRNIYSEK